MLIFLEGMCEIVMLGEDIPKQLKENGTLQCYPGMEDSDDEDLDESYDIQMGTYISIFYYFLYLNIIKIKSEFENQFSPVICLKF